VQLGRNGSSSQAQEPQVPLAIRFDAGSDKARLPGEELASVVEEANPPEDQGLSRTGFDVAGGTLVVDRGAA
jgi:hypothetical protein